jgi:hypothetical protein
MPRGKRPVVKIGDLSAEGLVDAGLNLRKMSDLAITEKTLQQYKSRCDQLEHHATGLGLPGVTKELFVLFCCKYRENKGGAQISLEGYRSAVVHWQRSGRWEGTWGSDLDILKAVKGARYRAGAAKLGAPKVGAIDEPMLLELVELVRQGPHGESMVEVLDTSFRCSARINGILGLRPSKVRRAPQGHVEILVPNKGYKAMTMDSKEPFVWQRVEGEIGERLMQKKGVCPGDELFFPVVAFRLAHLRSAVRNGAKVLGWGEDLQFRVHSLRHGGVQWLLAGGEEECLPSMTPGVRVRYAESNASRKRARNE